MSSTHRHIYGFNPLHIGYLRIWCIGWLHLFHLSVIHYHIASSSSSSSSSNNFSLPAPQWPLRFHKSPGLREEFLVRTNPQDSFETLAKCAENIDASESCQTNDKCPFEMGFYPSAHCKPLIKKKREERMQEIGLSVDELLDRFSSAKLYPKLKLRTAQSPYLDGPQNQPIFERCHYLTEQLITEMCHTDRKAIRKQMIHNLKLRTCRRFALDRTLSQHLYSLVINSTDCARILREIMVLDDLVEEMACEYESILQRYDCEAKWSVKWSCRDCRLAYRDWLCSVFLPYHTNGKEIKPCQSVCEQVEQKCPHLHPYGDGQYAGEPVFLCIDPNIPFNEQITPNIPYGPQDWCYNSCDLETCLNDNDESPVLACYDQSSPAMEVQVVKSEQHSTESYATSTDYNSYVTNDFDQPSSEHDSNSDIETNTISMQESIESTLNNNDISETYFDDKVSTSTFGWKADENDYYLIQSTADKPPNKLIHSAQYLELEPNFEIIDGKSKNPVLNSMETFENSESTTNVANDQEIYIEAIASTTQEPIENELASDEFNAKEINLFNEDLIKEDIQDEWTAVRPATTATTTEYKFENFMESSTQPAGTERTKNEHGLKFQNKHNEKESSHQQYETGFKDSGINRFRHRYSRTKEYIQQQQQARHAGGYAPEEDNKQKRVIFPGENMFTRISDGGGFQYEKNESVNLQSTAMISLMIISILIFVVNLFCCYAM